MTDRKNPWVTLSRERRYEDRYLGVDLDQLRHESGREHPHVALRFKVFGVAVLPVDPAGRVTLIGQYRYVLDRFTWELPRGSGPVSDDALATARRELRKRPGTRRDPGSKCCASTPRPAYRASGCRASSPGT